MAEFIEHRFFLMYIGLFSTNVKKPDPSTQEDSNIERSVLIFEHSTSFIPSPYFGTPSKLLSALSPCFSVSAAAILLCFYLLQ